MFPGSTLASAEIRRRRAIGLSIDEGIDLFSGRRRRARPSSEAQEQNAGRRKNHAENGNDDHHQLIKSDPRARQRPSKQSASLDQWCVISTPRGTARPTSASGGTSFHFKLQNVYQSATGSRAVEHEAYVTRDEAVELCSSRSTFGDGYILRPGAIEARTDTTFTPVEALDPKGRQQAIWSNIGDTDERRASFWEAAERRANKSSGVANVRVHPGKIHLNALDDAAIRSALPAVREALIEARELIKKTPDADRVSLKPLTVAIDLTDVETAEEWVRATSNRDGKHPHGVTVNPPRAGIVQARLVADLPHELTPEGRARIVIAFVKQLDAFGLMYTAAIHAPDGDNDARNFHLHVNWSDQPGRWLDDKGVWDFDYEERSSPRGRVKQPYRRKRIAHTTRFVKGEEEKSGKNFIGFLRRAYADCVNAELAAASSNRHFDPRTYQQMGVEQSAQVHLGSAASRLVAAGAIVDADVNNAEKYYAAQESRIVSTRDQTVAAHKVVAAAATSQLEPLLGDLPRHQRRRVCKALAEFAAAGPALAQANADVEMLRLLRDRALSRSTVVIADCDRQLAGRSHLPSTTSAKTRTIEKRREEALRAAARIDARIARGQAAADAARKALWRHEGTVTYLTQELVQAIASAAVPPATRRAKADENRLVHEHAGRSNDWDRHQDMTREVLNDVSVRRLRIVRSGWRDGPEYVVQELMWTDGGEALCGRQDYVQGRLSTMFKFQRAELARLEAWFGKNQRRPELMSNTGEMDSRMMPRAIQTLFGHYAGYPEMLLVQASMMAARGVGAPAELRSKAEILLRRPKMFHPQSLEPEPAAYAELLERAGIERWADEVRPAAAGDRADFLLANILRGLPPGADVRDTLFSRLPTLHQLKERIYNDSNFRPEPNLGVSRARQAPEPDTTVRLLPGGGLVQGGEIGGSPRDHGSELLVHGDASGGVLSGATDAGVRNARGPAADAEETRLNVESEAQAQKEFAALLATAEATKAAAIAEVFPAVTGFIERAPGSVYISDDGAPVVENDRLIPADQARWSDLRARHGVHVWDAIVPLREMLPSSTSARRLWAADAHVRERSAVERPAPTSLPLVAKPKPVRQKLVERIVNATPWAKERILEERKMAGAVAAARLGKAQNQHEQSLEANRLLAIAAVKPFATSLMANSRGCIFVKDDGGVVLKRNRLTENEWMEWQQLAQQHDVAVGFGLAALAADLPDEKQASAMWKKLQDEVREQREKEAELLKRRDMAAARQIAIEQAIPAILQFHENQPGSVYRQPDGSVVVQGEQAKVWRQVIGDHFTEDQLTRLLAPISAKLPDKAQAFTLFKTIAAVTPGKDFSPMATSALTPDQIAYLARQNGRGL